MAKSKAKKRNSNKNNEISSNEQIKKLQKEERSRLAYASLKDILQLINLEKNTTRTFQTQTREKVRSALKNPVSENNQKILRQISSFLYTVSHSYRRLINSRANQLKCKSWVVYPKMNMTEEPNPEDILNQYNKVCNAVNVINMKSQVLKLAIRAWQDDAVFAYAYYDKGLESQFYLHILPTDYCRISSVQYESGKINFAFDFSYFSGSNEDLLEYWDKEFSQKYNKYKNDAKLRWQELDNTKTFCLKIDDSSLDVLIPPLSGLFQSIISLVDLQDIQDIKEELSAYKLIWGKIDTISGSKEVDDFEIDLELANDFLNKIRPIVPENVGVAISPMDLNTLEFGANDASDTNLIEEAHSNILDVNGGVILNNRRVTNSTGIKMAMLADSLDAMRPIEQINVWINFFLSRVLGDTGMVVEYSDVSPYFEEDRANLLLKMASSGIPCKQQLASLIGLDPMKSYGMDYMESAVLGLTTERWNRPLVTSYTQSGTQEKDEGELSDEGIATRDKDKNVK